MLSLHPHHKPYVLNVTLHINDSSLPTVHNFGVIFNDTMTMSQHVSSVCRSISYHIGIGKICKYIDYDTCHAAARALVLYPLDNCYSLFNHIIQKDFIPKCTYSSPLLDELHLALSTLKDYIYCYVQTVSDISPYYLLCLWIFAYIIIWTFGALLKRLVIRLFRLLDHVYDTVFLFRSGTLN